MPRLRIAYTVTTINNCQMFSSSSLSFMQENTNKWRPATFLQRFHVAAGEGDADAMDGDLGVNRRLTSVLKSLE